MTSLFFYGLALGWFIGITESYRFLWIFSWWVLCQESCFERVKSNYHRVVLVLLIAYCIYYGYAGKTGILVSSFWDSCHSTASYQTFLV